MTVQTVTHESIAEFLGGEQAPAAKPAESATDENKGEEQGADADKKPNQKLEKRFSKLTHDRDAAREEARREREQREALEAKVRDLEGKKPTEQKPAAVEKPKREDYQDDPFGFAEAMADYTAKTAENDKKQQELANKEKVLKTDFETRLAAAKEELPDFDDMIASAADIQLPNVVLEAIMESELGPQILYHLCDNEELAEKIAGMTPAAALREIGKLEVRLEKPAVAAEEQQPDDKPQRKQPPEPIKPVKGGKEGAMPINSKGEWTADFNAYKAARKAGKIK